MAADIADNRRHGGCLQIQTMATQTVEPVTSMVVGREVGATMEASEVEAVGRCGGSGRRQWDAAVTYGVARFTVAMEEECMPPVWVGAWMRQWAASRQPWRRIGVVETEYLYVSIDLSSQR